jgi:hypothetical protein
LALGRDGKYISILPQSPQLAKSFIPNHSGGRGYSYSSEQRLSAASVVPSSKLLLDCSLSMPSPPIPVPQKLNGFELIQENLLIKFK